MPVEQTECDLVERRASGVDLSDDVDAVSVLVDHPGETAHLTLDARQSLLQILFALGVAP